MDKEQKFKSNIQLACSFLLAASLGLGIYFSDPLVFLALAILAFMVFAGSEAYLRIQHNIDRSIVSREVFLKQFEENKKINEETLDLLEILIDYLEEFKNKKDGQGEAG